MGNEIVDNIIEVTSDFLAEMVLRSMKGADNGFNPQQARDENGMWSSGSSVPKEEITDYNREGKDWFQVSNFPIDKVERLTDKIDDAAELIFRGTGDKNKVFKKFFEQLDELESNAPNIFEAARQNRILTRLEDVGVVYKDWTSVPNMLPIYRGDKEGAKLGKYNSFSFSKEVAQEFAGENGVVKEYSVHKNNIPWVNAGYLGMNEAEVILYSRVVKDKLKVGKYIGLGLFFKGADNGFNPQQTRDENGQWVRVGHTGSRTGNRKPKRSVIGAVDNEEALKDIKANWPYGTSRKEMAESVFDSRAEKEDRIIVMRDKEDKIKSVMTLNDKQEPGYMWVNILATRDEGKGLGRQAIQRAAREAANKNLALKLIATPEARSFYIKINMRRKGSTFTFTADDCKNITRVIKSVVDKFNKVKPEDEPKSGVFTVPKRDRKKVLQSEVTKCMGGFDDK